MSIEQLRQCELADGVYRTIRWIPIGEAHEGQVIALDRTWRVAKVYRTVRIVEDKEWDRYEGGR